MKKILCILIVSLGILLYQFPIYRDKTNLKIKNQIRVKYNDKIILISENDSKELLELLNNKPLYFDSPSCGFYEDFELIFSWGERVIPAFDGCDLLKDKKSKKYFSLERNREKFIEILEKYEIIVNH